MATPLEFYFDFSSPYGYFASFRVESLAKGGGREAVWKPVLIGVAFKQTGNAPLFDQPIKGEYARHDWQRLGSQMDVPWKLPEKFPFAATAASRTFYWLDDQDPEMAKAFARAAYHACFGEGGDITLLETVADIAASVGADREGALAAMSDPAIKERLRREIDASLEKGVFGSPFIIVDGESFWGADRLWMVKKWMDNTSW